MKNILITGLPRSGTTMICFLLNKIDNSVALHEPMQPHTLAGLDSAETVKYINEFFTNQRRQILDVGTAISKSTDGQVPTNPLSDQFKDGKRGRIINGRTMYVRNVHDADFYLYIKHPACFTAMLPVLSCTMECYATIRNPLAILLSWRNTKMNVCRGRLPAAESFDDVLAAKLSSETDILERQFILLDYFFRRYARHLSGRTLKYEDIVSSRGRALTLLNPAAHMFDEPLNSRNKFGLQHDRDTISIAEKLMKRDLACWDFYNRKDVEDLLN